MTETQIKGTVYLMKGNGLLYVGSTTRELKIRLSHHKSNYRCGGYGTSKLLFNGDDDVTIEPLEEGCSDLKAREKYWIEQHDCVNKCIPGRTQDERERHAEQLSTRHICPCGSIAKYNGKVRHEKTKRHQLYLDSIK